jgi:hypothetical protein
MPSSVFSLPVGFSWLSPAYHPSKEEIETYASLIAEKEGAKRPAAFRREAELQLWVWRNETQQRPPRRRPHDSRAAAAAVIAT